MEADGGRYSAYTINQLLAGSWRAACTKSPECPNFRTQRIARHAIAVSHESCAHCLSLLATFVDNWYQPGNLVRYGICCTSFAFDLLATYFL